MPKESSAFEHQTSKLLSLSSDCYIMSSKISNCFDNSSMEAAICCCSFVGHREGARMKISTSAKKSPRDFCNLRCSVVSYSTSCILLWNESWFNHHRANECDETMMRCLRRPFLYGYWLYIYCLKLALTLFNGKRLGICFVHMVFLLRMGMLMLFVRPSPPVLHLHESQFDLLPRLDMRFSLHLRDTVQRHHLASGSS